MSSTHHERRCGPRTPAARLVAVVLAAVVCAGLWTARPAQVSAAPLRSDQIAGKSAEQRGVDLRKLPDVAMASGILVTSDGTVLWSRNADQRRAMASITKIMTALVALDEADLAEKVTIPAAVYGPGESTAGLKPGDVVSMSDLLKALLVKSGNDASIAIALHVSGTEDEFVRRMNDKAADLGLDDTRFANPHGLDEKGHYTTAHDLATLSRVAMEDPDFRRMVSLKTVRVDGNVLESSNRLLFGYPGANGIKTGWTNDAGYCLAASADRGEVELIAIVLGTQSENARFEEARRLLDWGFSHYGPKTLAKAGAYVGRVPVADYLDVDVGAVLSTDVTATILDVKGPVERTVRLRGEVGAPVKAGQRVGTAVYTQDGQVVARMPVVASRDVAAPSLFERIGISVTRIWRSLAGTA